MHKIIIRTARHPAGAPRKLTPEQEREITRRYKLGGEKRKALCQEYGISAPTFWAIIKRTSLVTLFKQSGQTAAPEAAE